MNAGAKMGGQLQDFCATDGNDEMSSGRFSASQSNRLDATFEIYLFLCLLYLYSNCYCLCCILYLSLLHDVFAFATCAC